MLQEFREIHDICKLKTGNQRSGPHVQPILFMVRNSLSLITIFAHRARRAHRASLPGQGQGQDHGHVPLCDHAQLPEHVHALQHR